MSDEQQSKPPYMPSQGDTTFEVELHRAPIAWDLEGGSVTFFGFDTAMFWTDPSLVRMLLPLAEEMGIDLFRLLVANSSSVGTQEDYQNMVSTLGDSFAEGFLAWGKGVSAAGWGSFEMPEFDPDGPKATVIVNNPWEMSMQRSLPPEKRWGCPFLQGKLIGLFSQAFDMRCWANDVCYYRSEDPRVVFQIFPSNKTIKEEIKKLQKHRMLARERSLEEEMKQKTTELMQTKIKLEDYSKDLEQKVAERTVELLSSNEQLRNEIDVRKQAEAKKKSLIAELQKTLKEVNTLSGLLPICSSCKKNRDDKGYWNRIEEYIQNHSDAQFSHGLCDECSDRLYGHEDWYQKWKQIKSSRKHNKK